jgi:hypothetical protein
MSREIAALTADYEAWLSKQIPLVAEDLDRKHHELASDLMRFLRGTYYLWLVSQPDEVLAGPDVPCVGDLHVENFGTWIDAAGTRRWGVNDLDELAWGSYRLDLVRLATSALITPHVSLAPDLVCSTLLETWRSARPGRAADLASKSAHHLLEVLPPERGHKRYFADLTKAATGQPPPTTVAAVLRTADTGWHPAWYRRSAGTGSLGHQRYVAVDSRIAREAKQLGPPTAAWAATQRAGRLPVPDQHLFGRVLAGTSGPEPWRRADGWQIRRLAPDVLRIDLAGLAPRGAKRLLRSMAHAVVNVHGVAPTALAAAREHEATQPPDWLEALVEQAASLTRTQFAAQPPAAA